MYTLRMTEKHAALTQIPLVYCRCVYLETWSQVCRRTQHCICVAFTGSYCLFLGLSYLCKFRFRYMLSEQRKIPIILRARLDCSAGCCLLICKCAVSTKVFLGCESHYVFVPSHQHFGHVIRSRHLTKVQVLTVHMSRQLLWLYQRLLNPLRLQPLLYFIHRTCTKGKVVRHCTCAYIEWYEYVWSRNSTDTGVIRSTIMMIL